MQNKRKQSIKNTQKLCGSYNWQYIFRKLRFTFKTIQNLCNKSILF